MPSREAHQRAVMAAQIRVPRLTVERARLATMATIVATTVLVNGVVASVGLSFLRARDGSAGIAIMATITVVQACLITLICAAVLTIDRHQPTWVKAQQRRWTRFLERHLPTSAEFHARRATFHQAVEAAAEVLAITERLAQQDQFTQWRNLSEIDSAIELMVVHRSSMHTHDLSDAPNAVLSYVNAAERRYDEAHTPQYLADVVTRYLGEYVERKRPRSHRLRDLDSSAWGFLDMSLRFNCKTNIDWVLINTWRVGDSEIFDARLRSDVEEQHSNLDTFRAWWSVPQEDRSTRLSYEKVLLHAPVVVYAATAWDLEEAVSGYPITNTSPNIATSNGAPIEYVSTLWRSAAEIARFGNVDLDRIVRAARKITR